MKKSSIALFLAEQKKHINSLYTQSHHSTRRSLLILPILALLALPAVQTPTPSFAADQQNTVVRNADVYRMPIPIQMKLVAHTQRYVNSIAKNVMPNPKKKNVIKRGDEYIARYLVIDTTSATMEALPLEKGKAYKAIITYHEQEYQCRGASKKAALNGNFHHAKTRRLIEVLQYRQGHWR